LKTTGKIWIIFDAKTRQQSKPMSTLQAQAALLSLNLKDNKRYFMWTPGWTGWQAIKNFLETEQNYFVMAPIPEINTKNKNHRTTDIIDDDKTIRTDVTDPNVIKFTEIDTSQKEAPAKQNYGYFYEDFNADQIDPDAEINPINGSNEVHKRDRRVQERHDFKLEVLLINSSGRTFKTYSQNISVGGTLLEDELPREFVRSQFDLILINNFERDPSRGRLHFQGRVVGDFINPRRLMFLETDDHTRRKLIAMILSYAEYQKKASGG
jgi:hypothetical protein